MIAARVAGSATVAFLAAASAEAATQTPTIWYLLGYPFEAAGMIAALFGCACARFWSADQLRARKAFRWSLDIPVTALTLATAMAGVIELRPSPWSGLLLGTGMGVIGEGTFRIAKHYAEKLGLFGEAPTDGQ